jgi:hypothetical protein
MGDFSRRHLREPTTEIPTPPSDHIPFGGAALWPPPMAVEEPSSASDANFVTFLINLHITQTTFGATVLFNQKHDQNGSHQRKADRVDQLQGPRPHHPGLRELHGITSRFPREK